MNVNENIYIFKDPFLNKNICQLCYSFMPFMIGNPVCGFNGSPFLPHKKHNHALVNHSYDMKWASIDIHISSSFNKVKHNLNSVSFQIIWAVFWLNLAF